jgi:uncharacterized protein (DUF1810 family)
MQSGRFYKTNISSKLFICMNPHFDLTRFINAQAGSYENALSEIKKGRKQSHWMWYIFPQITGLGHSETAKFYSIYNLEEATAYLNHPLLGSRLVEISEILLILPNPDVYQIFGNPDDMKLRSSMTLFAAVPGADPVFSKILDKYFDGTADVKTLALIH